MLQAIRDRVTGIVAVFILGLLAIPFLFFGLESYIRAVPQDAVARVGDDEISVSEFQTSFARYRAQLRQQLGDEYDEIATNQPIARREHLDSMIDQLLLRQHAESLGLTIAPSTLIEVIRELPAFQVDGQFNREIYQQRLRAAGQSPRRFERELAEDLLLRSVPGALSASALVTDAEIDRFLKVQKETRRVELVEIPVSDFRDQVEVSEDDIEAYFAEHQGDFMTTERVTIQYVELDGRELAADLELDEAELERRYEAAQARYMTAERRLASHILLTTGEERSDAEARAEIAALRERVLEGEDFAELAMAYSDDPGSSAEGGDLGWIEPGDMVEPFEEALYALDQDEISAPVQSPFGWHLIHLREIRPPEGMSFEEARDEILAEYREQQADEIYFELSERLVDLVFADPTTLEPVAADLGLEIRTTGPFSRFGADEGIGSRREIIEAAFSDLVLLDRNVSDPIELDRNRLVAIKLAEHFPSQPRELAEVKDDIRERLIRERSSELARKAAESLIEELAAVEPEQRAELIAELIAEKAEGHGWSHERHEAVSRRDFQLGGSFLLELFRLPTPPPDSSGEWHITPKGGNWAVVLLEEVIPGDPAAAEEAERRSARQQLRFQQMAYDVSGLLEWLREETRIRVVEERL